MMKTRIFPIIWFLVFTLSLVILAHSSEAQSQEMVKDGQVSSFQRRIDTSTKDDSESSAKSSKPEKPNSKNEDVQTKEPTQVSKSSLKNKNDNVKDSDVQPQKPTQVSKNSPKNNSAKDSKSSLKNADDKKVSDDKSSEPSSSKNDKESNIHSSTSKPTQVSKSSSNKAKVSDEKSSEPSSSKNDKESNIHSSTSKPTQVSKSSSNKAKVSDEKSSKPNSSKNAKESNIHSSTSKPTQVSKSSSNKANTKVSDKQPNSLKNAKESNIYSSTSKQTPVSKGSSNKANAKVSDKQPSKPTQISKSFTKKVAKESNINSSTSKQTPVYKGFSNKDKVSDKQPSKPTQVSKSFTTNAAKKSIISKPTHSLKNSEESDIQNPNSKHTSAEQYPKQTYQKPTPTFRKGSSQYETKKSDKQSPTALQEDHQITESRSSSKTNAQQIIEQTPTPRKIMSQNSAKTSANDHILTVSKTNTNQVTEQTSNPQEIIPQEPASKTSFIHSSATLQDNEQKYLPTPSVKVTAPTKETTITPLLDNIPKASSPPDTKVTSETVPPLRTGERNNFHPSITTTPLKEPTYLSEIASETTSLTKTSGDDRLNPPLSTTVSKATAFTETPPYLDKVTTETTTPTPFLDTKPTLTDATNLPISTVITSAKTTTPLLTDATNLTTSMTTCLTTLPYLYTSLTTNSRKKNIYTTSLTSLGFSTLPGRKTTELLTTSTNSNPETTNHPFKPSTTSTFVTSTKPHRHKTPDNTDDDPPPPKVTKKKDKPYIPVITGSLPFVAPATATEIAEDLPAAIIVPGSSDYSSSPNSVGMTVKLKPLLSWVTICGDPDVPALFANVFPNEIVDAVFKSTNVKISPPNKITVIQLLRQSDNSGAVYMQVPRTEIDAIKNVLTDQNSTFYQNQNSQCKKLLDPNTPILMEDNSMANAQAENINNQPNSQSSSIGAIIVIAVCGSTLLYAGLTALVVRAYRKSKNRAPAARQDEYDTYTYSVRA